MNENPSGLEVKFVNRALAQRLPQYLGPWKAKKTDLGQSNPTFVLFGKNKSLVLRRKPHGNLLRSAHLVEREFAVMKALKSTLVPVPKVYYLCEDPAEIGSVYFVMEFIDGITFPQPDLPNLDSSQRAKVYDEMNFGLAALHSVIPREVGLEKFGKSKSYFERQLMRWSKQFDASSTERIFEMESLE